MNPPHPHDVFCRSALRRRFDRAAESFAGADFVHRQCFAGLLERMQPLRLEARNILDLGAAVGCGSRELGKRYRRARIVSLDLSQRMLAVAKRERSWFARISEVQADAEKLPLVSGSFDLVVANLLLPWLAEPQTLFREVARVLRKDGVFMFTSLGPGSLRRLRDAWGTDDRTAHVNPFLDMHDVGDALLRATLADPVLDVDHLTVSYRDHNALFRDLRAVGGRNALRERRKTLTGKDRFARMTASLDPERGRSPFEIELELVFGHAWGRGATLADGEFHISPAAIERRPR